MSERTPEDVRWVDLLRMIGLGLGLHEPLRTKMIEEGYEHLRAALAAHDAQVKAGALREAGVAAGVKAVTDRVRAFIGTFDEVREDDGEDPVALIVRVKDVRRLLDQIDAELGGE